MRELTGKNDLPKARYAILRKIFDPATKELIDKGLVMYFPAPQSFTGEDCCEFQVHGGLAIIKAMLDALSKVKGLCPGK